MTDSANYPGRPAYRVVLLGDQGVGKSSISLRFLKDEFHEHHSPTIGAAYLTQTMKVGEQTVKLDLWDTAGQERFASLAPMYYRTAQTAIVVYDICSKKTFDRALTWVQELKNQAPPNTIIFLCGNKVDMALDAREIKAEDASIIAEEQGLVFMEVSAKTGQGVKTMFQSVANKLAQKANGPRDQAGNSDKNIKLSSRGQNDSNSSCPC